MAGFFWPGAFGQGVIMEGTGTDFDWKRDLRNRIERTDQDLQDLKSSFASQDRTIAQMVAVQQTQGDILTDIKTQLQAQHSKKTPVWAAAAALVALLSGGIAVQTFIFAPYQNQVLQLSERTRSIEGSRYTEEDASRDFDRLEEEIDAEVADTRENLQEIKERLRYLERQRQE